MAVRPAIGEAVLRGWRRTAPGCGMTNHGQFDFRGLLRKTNTHIADDVYPHQIPVGTMCCPG